MDCTIYVAKTKALISFAVTAKLVCVFVFAYANRWFSHDAAHIVTLTCNLMNLLNELQSFIVSFSGLRYFYLM